MFSKGLLTVGLLVMANLFMTLAWYGHLKFKDWGWLAKASLPVIILISWGIALLEYCFQVPANKIGFSGNGGPYNLWQLKVMQEVITLVVFTIFTLGFFKHETLRWNHLVGFSMLVGAVYFLLKK